MNVPIEYLIHLITIVGYFGYAILFLIIFLESFPLTFFLPGDSLLFTTGFLASQGYFNLALLVLVLFLASVSGYIFSYVMGTKLRDFILRSGDRYWFKRKHLEYTEHFYEKYGDKTIIIGRFVPIVRSFAPTLAGAAKMSYKKFAKDAVIGGVFWAAGMTSVGYYLGRSVPDAHLYLTPIILAIIFVSMLPSIYEYIHYRMMRNKNN
jgi:membrane-associated protein